jgi:hypothetical protein
LERFDLAECLTGAREPPVLKQLGLVQHASTNRSCRRPRVVSIGSSVSILTMAAPSACRAWKCGGP